MNLAAIIPVIEKQYEMNVDSNCDWVCVTKRISAGIYFVTILQDESAHRLVYLDDKSEPYKVYVLDEESEIVCEIPTNEYKDSDLSRKLEEAVLETLVSNGIEVKKS